MDQLIKFTHFIPVRTDYSLQKLVKLYTSEIVRLHEKKILRFDRKGKLSIRFIKPHRILKCVGPITYQLELPSKLDRIHDVFHVSMLRRYHSDPTHIVPVEDLKDRQDLTFKVEPVQVLDRDVKVLRKKSIPLVKVLSRNHSTEEAMWEHKDMKRQQYPHIF
ncbi:uncharacterized protein LOC108468609 [Gossypium arboreum]|uniref:uncharacterized protein LOC108468609 n=1 Tax=Gossypium arboreum TaxID=29729 RepID=UPI0008190D31|nr:uncharacterized protein LOC108468609 [Gossypium arboreum]